MPAADEQEQSDDAPSGDGARGTWEAAIDLVLVRVGQRPDSSSLLHILLVVAAALDVALVDLDAVRSAFAVITDIKPTCSQPWPHQARRRNLATPQTGQDLLSPRRRSQTTQHWKCPIFHILQIRRENLCA